MSAAISALLDRPERMGMRPVVLGGPYPHPGKDPGVYRKAQEFLRSFLRLANYALVVLDRDGCGRAESRTEIEAGLERRLAANGWENRCAAIVIDPELENWVWSDSPHVGAALGWPAGDLRNWLSQRGHWPEHAKKPPDPKSAVEAALREKKIARSSAIYADIARNVGFDRCVDPAFIKLRTTLQGWFPIAR